MPAVSRSTGLPATSSTTSPCKALNAEIFPSSFLGKAMNGEEVSAIEGSSHSSIPKLAKNPANFPAPEGPLPIRFNRYRVPSLSTHSRRSGGSRHQASPNPKPRSNPETVNGRPQLSFYRGDIAIAGWPKLRIDRALIEFRGDEVDVIGLRILHETDSRGVFELSGTVSPLRTRPPVFILAVASAILSNRGHHRSGHGSPALRENRFRLRHQIQLPLLPAHGRSGIHPRNRLPVSPSSQIELRGFPFLLGPFPALDDPWFQSPVFDTEASGIIQRENGVVTLRDLNLESKGRIAIRGEVSMAANQQLSGKIGGWRRRSHDRRPLKPPA